MVETNSFGKRGPLETHYGGLPPVQNYDPQLADQFDSLAGLRLYHSAQAAPGASLICVIIFIRGIIMLRLGVMGQYLAEIYIESKRRPHYISRESNIKDVKKPSGSLAF